MIDGQVSIAVGGQSLAQMFRMRGKRTFNQRLRELAPHAPRAFIWGHTRGGTYAASTNTSRKHRDLPERYWWNLADDRPSAHLVSGLDGKGPTLVETCDCLIWDLGQFETGALLGKNGRDPVAARADFIHASGNILAYWRCRMSPTDPCRIPILIVPHAPHPAEKRRAGSGAERVREAQLHLASAMANCHVCGMVEDMEMTDNMHPSIAGIQTYARCVADSFCEKILPRIDLAATGDIRTASIDTATA